MTRDSAALIASGLGLIAICELVAAALRSSTLLPDLLPGVSLLAPALTDGALAFVGAGVAAAATLLGLYYATVGVVASTVYRDVPGEVRELFVRERSGEIYIYTLVLAVAGGLTVLALTAFGYRVSGLTLAVLAALAVLTTVWLAVLGQRLFGFFDPTMLSRSLPKRITQAISDAAGPRTRASESRQRRAHAEAASALLMYRQIAEIVERANYRDARAPLVISDRLLRTVAIYSQRKDAIPTGSAWWGKVPENQNWLTIDFLQLNMAMETASGVVPKLVPDPLWFERAIVGVLRVSLPASIRARGGADLLSLADTVASVAAVLSARLHVREALMIEEAWCDAIRLVADEALVDGPQDLQDAQRLSQQAAAESLVIPLTHMWLGFRAATSRVLERDVEAQFDAAVAGGRKGVEHLPNQTRNIAETFAAAIAREHRTEGRRVTPAWWANHYLARTLSDEVLTTHAAIIAAIDGRTTKQIGAFRDAGRPDLAAVIAIASLELLHKVEVHTPTVAAAQAKLASFRNPNTENDAWPATDSVEPAIAKRRATITVALAELMPELHSSKFRPDAPDLYGQAYQFVLHAAFNAILNSDTESALKLYAAVFSEVWRLRHRIHTDLADRSITQSLGYVVEPVVAAMELAGLALFMQEADEAGIWVQVQASWDLLIAGEPNTPHVLMAAVQVTDDMFYGGRGQMSRSARASAFTDALEARGLADSETSRRTHPYPFSPAARRHRPHRSPIVSAMMPSYYGHINEFHHLFVAGYLAQHLPPETEYDPAIESLIQQLELFRSLSYTEQPKEGGADES